MSSDFVREQIEKSTDDSFRNRDAESAVIGYILTGSADVEDIMGKLGAEDFGFGGCGKIYSAIQHVVSSGQKVDLVTVGQALMDLYPPETEKKLAPVLVEFYKNNFLYRARNVDEWLQIIRSLATRRRAIEDFSRLLGNLRDPKKDIAETLAEIGAAALEADSGDAKWMSGADVALNTFEYLEKRQTGAIPAITSGIAGIDRMIGGFFGGELTVVAARPAVGKSAFGLNIAMSATDKGYKVCFVSCEMSDTGFGQRILSRESWVNGEILRKAEMSAEDWDKLSVALSLMNDVPIEFMFPHENPNGMTLENVAHSVRRKAKRREIDMLVVDYIGILQTERRFKEDHDRVKYITSELKKLSQVANIPVIALCQVNREAHGSMPTLAQLRDSGSVEQDADGVIFLHRPDDNRDSSIHPDDVSRFDDMNKGTAYLAVNVAKQRNGNTGMINLIFDPRIMRYAEIVRAEPP
jgi:replicative DNA helicase